MKKEKLFDVFPPITDKEWKDKIIADLKGANFDKTLVWKTDEGIDVQPYYRSTDFTSLSHTDILPGNFPFVRGNHVKDNKWLIRQNIKVKDIEKANKKQSTLFWVELTPFALFLKMILIRISKIWMIYAKILTLI